MRVPETGRPKTVSVFSSTINLPPRVTEIFAVPLEASAFGCAANLTVRAYSPARFARNACSGPGSAASAAAGTLAAAAGTLAADSDFWNEPSCADVAIAVRISKAKSVTPRLSLAEWLVSLIRTSLHQQDNMANAAGKSQISLKVNSVSIACVRLFRFCRPANGSPGARGRRCRVRALRG